MAISLYAATVPSYLQILDAMSKLIDKAQTHCSEKSIDPNLLLQARLAEDMQPFVYQIKSVVVHSLGAIEGARKGVFSPDMSPAPQTFDALRTRVTQAMAALNATAASEVDGLVGRDMRFVYGEHQMAYTAEDFLLSFSVPNFYFHATTAYDILRWKGLPIGKRDYLGRPRIKP
jgi:hypothetical protein